MQLDDDGELSKSDEYLSTYNTKGNRKKKDTPPSVSGCLWQQFIIALIGLITALISFLALSNPLITVTFGSVVCNNIFNEIGTPVGQLPLSTSTFTPIRTAIQQPTSTPVEVIFFDIHANRRWQSTGINVNRGDRIVIRYIDGCWSGGNNVVSCPENCGLEYECPNNYGSDIANGLDTWNCMPMDQNLTGYNAIIGRIGDNHQPFVINKFYEHIAELSGELQVRMNDCDEWLFDNQGIIVISIERYES